MTQHPDITRSPAHRRAARRAGTLSAALLAVVAVVGSAVLPASAAGPMAGHPPAGASSAPAAVTRTAPGDGAVHVSVTSISHPIAVPGDTVTVRASVTNTTDAVIDGAEAQFTVDYLALTSRAEIAAWSEAGLLDPVYGTGSTTTVPRLAPGASTTVSFTYDPGVQALQGFGARRLAISVGDASGRLGIARSFLMYDADGTERVPMKLSVLAAVTSPATDPADPSSAELELAQQTAAGQRLDGVLQVAEHNTVSLAVDPNLMGTAEASQDPELRDWYDRMLAAAGTTATFTLPDHDPDLAALAHAGVLSTGPRSFVRGPRAGVWEIPATWHTNFAWPADGTVPDVETLGLAVASGRDDVVVGAGGLAYEGVGTVTGRAEVATPAGTAHAVVTDEPLTEAFLAATDLSGADSTASAQESADTTAVTTASTATEGAQRLLAETAAVVSQAPYDPPSLSIVAPRSWTPDTDAAKAVLDTLDEAGWISPTTLDALFVQDAPEVARTPLPKHERAKAELAAADVKALEQARDAIVTFSSVAGEEHPVIWRPGVRRLIAPLAVARRADPGLREQVVQQVLQENDEITKSSVTVVPRQDINFITDVGNIPVRVRNALTVDATVTVVLRPDHPRLTVDERTTETVPAGQEMDVQVPVRAIGSGDVEVTAQVLTPTGAKINDDSTFQVRVRAGWEEVGTWIAAGLVALLFLAGIWRTVRRGRSPNRATREDVEEATGTAAEAPETAPATSGTPARP
ncbi:DUF6049 family protein [Promicromonospora sp. MS192]|uniref:DUF6049 family protein n=1 Tax=Promicromonospora sp. MS192 TaxID=3412684 RepID=UPI003C2EEC38